MNQEFRKECGPTICHANGRQEWFKDGELHRPDGPAIIHPDGTQLWYWKGKQHRLDGPAVLNSDGSKAWFQNGLLHRLDGPAVELANGVREWWVDGVTVAPFRDDVFDLKVAAARVVREMSYHTASISNEGNMALKRLADVLVKLG